MSGAWACPLFQAIRVGSLGAACAGPALTGSTLGATACGAGWGGGAADGTKGSAF
jgi:hypothetical protein